jgi:ketosteroid isomerase-like protein
MKTETSVTETVVRNHLQTFLEQRGVPAILADYDEDARFYTPAKLYQGKPEIHGFFTDFIGSLPEGAIDLFALTSLQVDGNIASITWSVGTEIPLGTDTFVVEGGKIVAQSFAMYAAGGA